MRREGTRPTDYKLSVRVVDIDRWELLGEVALPYAPGALEGIETGWVSERFLYAENGGHLYYVRPDKDPALIKVDVTGPAILGRLSLPAPQNGSETAEPGPARRLLAAAARLATPRAEAKGGFALNVEAFLSPDGRRLYFTGGGRVEPFIDALWQEHAVKGDGIWVVDTSSMAVVGHWLPGREFFGEDAVWLSPDGLRIYAMDAVTNSLVVVDAQTGEEIGRVENLGDSPWSIEAVVRVIAGP